MEDIENYDAILMIAASERDADLYYTTGFLAPDSFIYLHARDQKVIVASDLEIDRAKAQSRVDRVLAISKYEQVLKDKGVEQPGLIDVTDAVLKEYQIGSLLVPGTFPIEYADSLRERGYQIGLKKGAFFEERAVKSESEVEAIRETLRVTEEALDEAIEAIRKARIGTDGLLYINGKIVTAEAIKRIIGVRLMEEECVAQHTIVAVGEQGCDPHNQGSGPLFAHQTIILDVFPRSSRTHYYADITRTIVRGRASDELRRMHQAVEDAQEIVFGSVKAGVNGEDVHKTVQEHFDARGFKSGEIGGRMQGFFHGTGHGVGLEIHEPPRISKRPDQLKAGHVVTVEPGLYYLGIGGVRIEDMIVVQDDGCENLTEYPKVFEV